MNVIGIIAEYNPFHRGHAYQIAEIREKYHADHIIVAMSGDFVQRGAPALFPKHLRARMALLGGADLVLELPVSASTASAEFFAKSGVALLDQLGVSDGLCFGCEDGDEALFSTLARILTDQPEKFRELLRGELKKGNSFPAARSAALTDYLRTEQPGPDPAYVKAFLSKPNNLLGLEYYKALYGSGSKITPLPLVRRGSGYHETEVEEEKFASATAIRQLLSNVGQEQRARCVQTGVYSADDRHISFFSDSDPISQEDSNAGSYAFLDAVLPEFAAPLVETAVRQRAFVEESDLDLLLQYALTREASGDFTSYLDVSEALSNRIRRNLNACEGFHEFASQLKSRELTHTRISRALLHILLDIREAPREIPYARVLGFRKDSAALLSEIKRKSSIPVLTKPADAPKLLSPYGQALLAETTHASNIYERILCHKSGQSFRHEYQKPIILI